MKEILGNRKILLRMADMQGTAESGMTKHIVCVCNDSGEFGNEVYALTHQIIAGSVIGFRVEAVHFEYAACQDIHNVVSFQLNDIHLGFLLQRHVIIDKFAERSQFLFIGQITGQQQIGHFLKSETLLLHKCVDNIFHIISPVEQFTRNRLQATAGNTFVTHYVTNPGKPDQHTRAIFITQTAFHIKLGEQFSINPNSFLHILGELINDVFLLHFRIVLIVSIIFLFFLQSPA